MSDLTANGPCGICKEIMDYNPERVPTVAIKEGIPDPKGTMEPLCIECIGKINQHRHQIDPEGATYPQIDITGAYESMEI